MVLDKGEYLWPWPEPLGKAPEVVKLEMEATLRLARAIHDPQELELLPILFTQLGKPGPEMDSACQS